MTIRWDAAGLARCVAEDAGVNAEMMRIAESKAMECSASAAALMHSPMRDDAYDAERRVMPSGWPYAVVHPSTNAGAAINRRHGVLHW